MFEAFGGGIAQFNRELALAMAERHDVRLIGKHDRTGNWRGLPLWGAGRCPAPIRTGAFVAGALASAIRRRPELIVCGHVHFAPAARWLFSRPYVVCAFGVEAGEALSPIRVRALRSASAVFAISRWTAARVEKLGVPSDRVRLVPVTISDNQFAPGSGESDLRERLGLSPDDRVILTVGRLDPAERYKGYDSVLKALPRVRAACGPVRYLVVGAGGDIGRLKGLATDLGVSSHVIFTGFVPETEKASYYRLADAFAMPSIGEGFGIVFLEAMATGLPVLGGDRDGTRDALRDGELGMMVDPTSIEAIASGLIQLLEHRGPPLWFDRHALRQRCLDLYGRSSFRQQANSAVDSVLTEIQAGPRK